MKVDDLLQGAIATLRLRFTGCARLGQDQFFGIRTRILRRNGHLCLGIDWHNALVKDSRGELLAVPCSEGDAVAMVLHAELAKLRASLPRALPKAFIAPAGVALEKRAET